MIMLGFDIGGVFLAERPQQLVKSIIQALQERGFAFDRFHDTRVRGHTFGHGFFLKGVQGNHSRQQENQKPSP